LDDPADVRLEAFDPSHAATILGWARSPEEREAWAALSDPDPTPDVFSRWHADVDVHPHTLFVDDRLAAYGEIWDDHDANEAEIARVIVAPDRRGRGIGRLFVGRLADRARASGFGEVWIRVVPTNAAALACYAHAGFFHASPEQEAAFNRGQSREYVWMRLADRPPGVPRLNRS
jgi:GNAT superfamily N-acetyltransferase